LQEQTKITKKMPHTCLRVVALRKRIHEAGAAASWPRPAIDAVLVHLLDCCPADTSKQTSYTTLKHNLHHQKDMYAGLLRIIDGGRTKIGLLAAAVVL
jgi:hypothetical protein